MFGQWLLISTSRLCFKSFTTTGYPLLGFVEYLLYKLHFLGRGFSLVYKRNFAKILVDFRELGYFRSLLSYILGVGILVFQTGCDILCALRGLEWVSENCDLFKTTRRLPRVGPSGRGVTIPIYLPTTYIFKTLKQFIALLLQLIAK